MTSNAPANETQVAYHRRRAEELRTIRTPWETIWTPLAEFIEPTRLRLNSKNEGATSRSRIIDSTGTFALRTLQSGMHSGITSPARPWFRLTTYDPDLKDFGPVKEYLATVENQMREVFQSSNIYNSFHAGYGDLGQFGQSVGLLIEDEQETIRMQQLVHGRFWIARDERGMMTTLYRQFRWSVSKIVTRFKLERCSQPIQEAYKQGKYDQCHDIWHAIEPRMSRNRDSIAKHDKPFLSNYWEDLGAPQQLLEESGFDENPIIGPSWEVAGDDHYSLSPGQIALGDVKMLQLEQQRKMEAIDKKVRPPMTGPTSMKNNPASLLPGSVTFVDDPTGKGYRPAMEVQLQLNELLGDIRETQDRVNRAFYADLFLMLANMEGIQPRNSFEIAERKEEKLLALGPVLENIYNGQLEPVIDRTFAIMDRRGMLPEPPKELQGVKLKVEYTSMLAQAQKAIGVGSIERGVAFAGQMAGMKPDILDRFDADDILESYWDMIGAPPSNIIPLEEAEKIRAGRAQKQAQADQAEMAATVAPAAKDGAQAANLMASAMSNPSGGALLSQLGIG